MSLQALNIFLHWGPQSLSLVISAPIALVIYHPLLLSPTTAGLLMCGKNWLFLDSIWPMVVEQLQQRRAKWKNTATCREWLVISRYRLPGCCKTALPLPNASTFLSPATMKSSWKAKCSILKPKTSPLVPIRGGCLLCHISPGILPSLGLTTAHVNAGKTWKSHVRIACTLMRAAKFDMKSKFEDWCANCATGSIYFGPVVKKEKSAGQQPNVFVSRSNYWPTDWPVSQPVALGL